MDIARLPQDLSFEAWIEWLFDREDSERSWWWDDYDKEWDFEENHEAIVEYLTKLFCEPKFLFDRYSRNQINNGFSYMISNSCSNTMYSLLDVKVPWKKREACFRGISTLFKKLFAKVYTDDLGHLSREGDSPTFACYMWWDVIPIYARMGHPEQDLINDVVIEVLRQILQIDSEACMESALHGLGHWQLYLPNQTEPIVIDFLMNRENISIELRSYAEAALCGQVL